MQHVKQGKTCYPSREKRNEKGNTLTFRREEGISLLLVQKDTRIETLNNKINALQIERSEAEVEDRTELKSSRLKTK